MSKIVKNIRTSVDSSSIIVELVRVDSASTSTVLGTFRFNRVSAELSCSWSVDGRDFLSFPERWKFVLWFVRLVSKMF